MLRHNKIDLALWHLAQGAGGLPLLCLHGLGERTDSFTTSAASTWKGPVLGLDFAGHGASSTALGGGYSTDSLIWDVDAALDYIGESALLGRGLGAYIALLVAGMRPTAVRGTVLLDGPGLSDATTAPRPDHLIRVPVTTRPDPIALAELLNEPRRPELARTFARQAALFSGLDPAIAVVAASRPPWLAATIEVAGVAETDVLLALEMFQS